jgi:hypothetical protein
MSDRAGSTTMNAEELLEQAAVVVAGRRSTYGQPIDLFEQVATRWSLVIGVKVTPAQALLCLMDLKLAVDPRPTAPRQHHGHHGLCRLPGRGAVRCVS